MKVKYYRKKPVIIEAIQLKKNDESIKDCLMFCEIIDDEMLKIYNQILHWRINDTYKNDGFKLFYDRKAIHVNFGDYILKDEHGKIYPCKPDIFKKTYEAV